MTLKFISSTRRGCRARIRALAQGHSSPSKAASATLPWIAQRAGYPVRPMREEVRSIRPEKEKNTASPVEEARERTWTCSSIITGIPQGVPKECRGWRKREGEIWIGEQNASPREEDRRIERKKNKWRRSATKTWNCVFHAFCFILVPIQHRDSIRSLHHFFSQLDECFSLLTKKKYPRLNVIV